MAPRNNLQPFWKEKSLETMTADEWELLCDGCAQCCLQKMEDEETGEMHYTRIVCRYLDETTCRCTQYEQRTELVPTCLKLTCRNINEIHFLPRTCAYRLVLEGKELLWWHRLISGNSGSVHAAGISIRGKVVCEEHVHPDGWDEHIIDWIG